ncbi:MAG: 3'-5' exonuclease [Candidatus Tritonobacter lacicola]|nr:3'-5' exonuclease [Candidatus Tritonobacter lacicola]
MNSDIIGPSFPIEKTAFTIIDTETTGVNPGEGHEIIEIGMARYSGRKVTDTFETLIRPTLHPTKEAAAIHGISPEELKEAPLIEEVIDGVIRFIGDTVIAAHNINFDMTFIHTSLRRLGRPVLRNWAIDTILLSMRTWPGLKCHCLRCLGPALELDHSGTHRALEDVFATTDLLDKIISELFKRGRRTLGDLNPFKKDFTWREGDVYQEIEAGLRSAMKRNAFVHLYLYEKNNCIYFRQTVEPIRVLENGNLLARVLGEEKEMEFSLSNIIKVSPTYKE